jgi:imidazolonepropionase-like amidohydrolase
MWDFVHRFWRAGGTVIAGSDGVPFAPLGVIHEVELLAGRARLSPLAALQAATLNAAAALGLEHDVGTIEVGKLADLLLLDADPLRELAALRRIAR